MLEQPLIPIKVQIPKEQKEDNATEVSKGGASVKSDLHGLTTDKVKDFFEDIKENFKNTMSPKGYNCGEISNLVLSPSKKFVLAYKQGGEIAYIIPADNPSNSQYDQLKFSQGKEQGLVKLVFGLNDRTLYYALRNGKVFGRDVSLTTPNTFKDELILDLESLKKSIITLCYVSERLFISTTKSELYDLDLMSKEKYIIDRLSPVSQICISKTENLIAYSTLTQVRIYSKKNAWLIFEKSYETEEESLAIIDFSKQHDCAFFIAYNKVIQMFLISNWKLKHIFNSKICIKAMKVTEDDAWVTALCRDFSIAVWSIHRKEMEPVFITNNISEIDTYEKYLNVRDQESKALKKKSTDTNKSSYCLEIDYFNNKIYTTTKEPEKILCWNGPFLDRVTLADSTFEKNKQSILAIKSTHYVLVTDYNSKRLLIWDYKGSSEKCIKKQLSGNPLCLKADIKEEFLAVGFLDHIDLFKILTLDSEDCCKTIKTRNTFEDPLSDLAFNCVMEQHVKVSDCIYYCSGSKIYMCYIMEPDPNPLPVGILKNGPVSTLQLSGEMEMAKVVVYELDNLIVGCESGNIYVYSIEKQFIIQLHGHKKAIEAIVVFKKDLACIDRFVSSCSDGFFIVWSIEDQSIVKKKKLHFRISSLYLSKDENELIVSTQDGGISIFNLPGFVKILSLHYKNKKISKEPPVPAPTACGSKLKSTTVNIFKLGNILPGLDSETIRRDSRADRPEEPNQSANIDDAKSNVKDDASEGSESVDLNDVSENQQVFTITPDEKYIIVSNDNGVYRSKSPFSSANVKVYGFPINIREIFINIIASSEEIRMHQQAKKKHASAWVIGPYSVNIAHYYAYHNLSDHLKQELVNKSMYLHSDIGYPMDISLTLDNIEASGVILSELRKRAQTDMHALESINEEIVNLNRKGFKGLDELYKYSLIPNNEISIHTCNASVHLPIIRFASSASVHEEIFDLPKTNGEAQRIKFYRSCLRLNLAIGSQDSIDLLDSISNCPNTEIFDTRYIKTIIQYKWDMVKWVIIGQTVLNSVYLIPLCIYVISDEIYPYLTICAIFNTLLLIYEFLQLYGSRLLYFEQIPNYIDMIRNALFYLYYFYPPASEEDGRAVMCTIMVLSWLKGVSSFSLSSSTRYLVSLLVQALKETIGFAVIVCYSTLAFAFIKLSIDKQDGLVKTILDSYFVNVGSFDTNTDDPELIPFVIFMMATVINLVLMMNMLITILGGVVERVQEKSELEDLKQKTNMVIEVEMIARWNRNKKDFKVLHICEGSTPDEIAQGNVFTKFRSMKRLIGELKSTNENFKGKIDDYILNVDKKMANAMEKIESVKKDSITEMKSNNDELKRYFAIEAEERKKQEEEVHGASKIEDENLRNESTDLRRKTRIIKAIDDIPCIRNHHLKKRGISTFVCALCKAGKKSQKKYYCSMCNEDYCSGCHNFIRNHHHEKTGLTCAKDHILLKFDNLLEFYKGMNYGDQVICRQCNSRCDHNGFKAKNDEGKEFYANHEGFHCLLCIYSVCKLCVTKFDKLSHLHIACKCKSTMIWEISELYNSQTYSITCKRDKEERLGAGYYTCEGCKNYQYCLNCTTEKFLDEESGVPESEQSELESEKAGLYRFDFFK